MNGSYTVMPDASFSQERSDWIEKLSDVASSRRKKLLDTSLRWYDKKGFLFPILFSVLVITTGSDCLAKSSKPAEKPVASGGSSLNIIAVVGDHAISSFDLDSRIKFVFATTRMSNTPEVLANIKPQIIRTLIDESLQMQEAAKNNINVDDKEVAKAIATIEAQRGMPAGGIAGMLSSNHVPEKTFNDQIRAQLAWSKLLSANVRGRIKISDEEITLAQGHTHIAKADAPVNVKELEIAVINLPIDKPQRAAEIKKLGDRLYGELVKGARFEEVARQFSAGGDGKPFWIRPDQLDPNVAQVLKASKEGSITPPIPTHDGFSIIKLVGIKAEKAPAKDVAKDDAKDFEISLKEILLKLKETATAKEADVLLQIGQEVAKNPGTCEEKGIASIGDLSDFDIEVKMSKAAQSELPPALRTISDSLKVGEISNPFASAEGIRLYMLCGKKELTANSTYNLDRIRETLFRQKFELEAQKYLRNLRRETFIEVRG